MKTLYFECNMGAAGDMLMAALLELHDAPQEFLKKLNGIGIPNVLVKAQPTVKCGITGTHITVTVSGKEEDDHTHGEQEHHHHDHSHSENENHHSHNSYHDIEHLINHLTVSENVKKSALAVYKLIAEAESHVHGTPVNKIHFHEVGDMDAIADITGVCMLIEELAPDMILASPVNTGIGHVRCVHGVLPVPAPATAYILQNIPMYSDQTKGELCTPTGAALLKHFVKEFRAMPVISINKIGYGMGKKDFEKVNCVRIYIGEDKSVNEEVIELICNLDDMTPEAVAFAQQLLFDNGALDVYTTPIVMKKNRAGLSFTCMCRANDRDKMLTLIFKHTTTLGIREYLSRRYTLQKEQKEVETEFGPVRIKTSCGFCVNKSKAEYEDIAALAKKHDCSIMEIERRIWNNLKSDEGQE